MGAAGGGSALPERVLYVVAFALFAYAMWTETTSSLQVPLDDHMLADTLPSHDDPVPPNALAVVLRGGLPTAPPLAWLTYSSGAAAARGSGRTCAPTNKYVFVKTHKTGGSTLVNVLHRRTWRYNLTPVLPKNLVNLGWPHAARYGHVLGNKGHVFNITGDVFTNHVWYGGSTPRLIETMVPNATYFTILREPVKRFASAFAYYQLPGAINRFIRKQNMSEVAPLLAKGAGDSLAQFAEDPDTYGRMSPTVRSGRVRPITSAQSLLQNSMAFDLGVVGSEYTDMTLAASQLPDAIAKVSKAMALVLINEYWDQSMVLLKRRMCWNLNDVLYMSLKAKTGPKAGPKKGKKGRADTKAKRARERRSSRNIGASLRASARRSLEKYLSVDTALYEHFNRTFWEAISHEVGFDQEVQLLRQRVADLGARCRNGTLVLRALEQQLCDRLLWENVKFGCEIAKRGGLKEKDYVCKDCVFRCDKQKEK